MRGQRTADVTLLDGVRGLVHHRREVGISTEHGQVAERERLRSECVASRGRVGTERGPDRRQILTEDALGFVTARERTERRAACSANSIARELLVARLDAGG